MDKLRFGDYVLRHGHRPNNEKMKLRCAVCLAEAKALARKRSEMARFIAGLKERRVSIADRRGPDRRVVGRRTAERRKV